MTPKTDQTDLSKRIGIITISPELLFDGPEDAIKAFFCQFFPYRIETDYRLFRYYGMSPKFDEVEEGDLIPHYKAKLIHEDGKAIVKFEKVDNP
jgi:hypothetical protein